MRKVPSISYRKIIAALEKDSWIVFVSVVVILD